jgi:hypothetical protein
LLLEIKNKKINMKNNKKKEEQLNKQCSICSAKLEVSLDNSGISEERREKIGQHLLQYCPVCSKATNG